jgi:hypothetical protein
MEQQALSTNVLGGIAWIGGTRLRPLRIGPLRGAGTGRMEHGEWNALLGRFVQHGVVDYPNFRRVRRLVEVYLSRLAETDPEAFIDAGDQIAFYLNAYNTIAIHQVMLHPEASSIRDVPNAFTRPYPLGRRNLSLHALHGGILRSFGDPRVHAAINPAARGAAALPSHAYNGGSIDAELHAAMRRLLADVRYDHDANRLHVSPILRWMGGDWLAPQRMPSLAPLLHGLAQPDAVLAAIVPYLPAELASVVERHQPRIGFFPFDWQLNSAIR